MNDPSLIEQEQFHQIKEKVIEDNSSDEEEEMQEKKEYQVSIIDAS